LNETSQRQVITPFNEPSNNNDIDERQQQQQSKVCDTVDNDTTRDSLAMLSSDDSCIESDKSTVYIVQEKTTISISGIINDSDKIKLDGLISRDVCDTDIVENGLERKPEDTDDCLVYMGKDNSIFDSRIGSVLTVNDTASCDVVRRSTALELNMTALSVRFRRRCNVQNASELVFFSLDLIPCSFIFTANVLSVN